MAGDGHHARTTTPTPRGSPVTLPGPEPDGALLRSAADRLEALRGRTPEGRWGTTGLLASRPEVVARYDDGSSEHVADARARTAAWIVALSPSVGEPLIVWLRATADALEAGDVSRASASAATGFALALLEQADARG